MTEKRFEKTKSDIRTFRIYDYEKEDAYFLDCDNHTVECLVDLLNAQHETIQQLQRELDKTIEMLNKEINTSEKAFDGLLKENEKLKEELKNLRRLANELYMEGSE